MVSTSIQAQIREEPYEFVQHGWAQALSVDAVDEGVD
jgi:hypothetical protein